MQTARRPTRRPALLVATAVVASLALLLLAASGTGYRSGAWGLPAAFTMIRWAAYLGIAGTLLGIVGLAIVRPRDTRTALVFAAAIAVAAASAWLPWSWKQRAGSVPPIHDITTDTQDPPAFVAVLPLRADAKNPAEYGGDSVAAMQRSGYPDLAPVRLPVAPGAAFARARSAAADMGWALVAADSAAGRIEATATTRWFGFKDDVVIRVRPDAAGSRVDVRSVSRVGGSDVGTNAARIRAYAARLTR